MDQDSPPGNRGRFPPGQSGNPKGRPPKPRADSAPTTALAIRPPAPAIRRDGWTNRASGHGTSRDRRTLTTYGVDIVTDIEAEQLRRSEFLAAAIIEQVPKEALKRDWALACEDKELGNAIRKQAEALGLDEILYETWTKENEAGGSAIMPVITGAQGELDTPLDEGAIASIDAFHVFEPQELTPAAYYNDIRSPKFRRPMTYRLQPITSGRSGFMPSTIVHETRLVIFPGLKTSKQTQPGQREGWGDSRLCRPRQVMADFGLAWGSAATLLVEHGKGTLEMDGFAEMMAQADGLDEFDRHIAANQMAWTALKMRVVDGKSKFSQSTGTLSGVSEMLAEFKSLMAAAAERPVSILMGVGATGLRSGDDDTRAWYSTVERERSKHLKPRHEQIIRLMLLATSGPAGGVEPEAWSVEYPPLWSPDEKQIAETRKIDMERAKMAIEAEIVSADDVAESFFKGDTYSPDIKVNWERREAQAKIAEEKAEALDAEAQEALTVEEPEEDDVPDPEDPPEDEEDEDDEDEEEGEDTDEDEGRVDGWREDKFNPNQPRDATGKFGSAGTKAAKAPKKTRAKAAPDPAKAAARAAKSGAALAKSSAARDAAAGRHALAVKAAAAKAAKAKDSPTPRNMKAAETAAAKAGKHAVSLDKHNQRVAKHEAAHAHAKAAAEHTGGEAKAKAKAKEQKPPAIDEAQLEADLKAGKARLEAAREQAKARAKAEADAEGKARGEADAKLKAEARAAQESAARAAEAKERSAREAAAKAKAEADARSAQEAAKAQEQARAAQEAAAVKAKAAEAQAVAKPTLAADSKVIVDGYDKPGNPHSGQLAKFTPEAQAAIRDGLSKELDKHGIIPRRPNAEMARNVEIANLSNVDAAYNDSSGLVRVSPRMAENLVEYHKANPKELGAQVRQGDQAAFDKVAAHHAVVHEQVHSSGPGCLYKGPGIFAEEMATEMTARVIVAESHGFHSSQLGNTGYAWIINPAISHIQNASGKTYAEAHNALGLAAVAHKSKKSTELIHGENVLHNLAGDALRNLGAYNAEAHKSAYNEFMRLSKEM